MTKKLKDKLINLSDVEFAEWIRTARAKDVRFVNLDQDFQSATKGWIIQQELTARAAEKHHWTLTPVFIIGFLTMIFAAIAAWPVAHDWIWPVKKASPVELAPVPRTEETPSPSATPPIGASPLPDQETSSPVATPKSEPQPQTRRTSRTRS